MMRPSVLPVEVEMFAKMKRRYKNAGVAIRIRHIWDKTAPLALGDDIFVGSGTDLHIKANEYRKMFEGFIRRNPLPKPADLNALAEYAAVKAMHPVTKGNLDSWANVRPLAACLLTEIISGDDYQQGDGVRIIIDGSSVIVELSRAEEGKSLRNIYTVSGDELNLKQEEF